MVANLAVFAQSVFSLLSTAGGGNPNSLPYKAAGISPATNTRRPSTLPVLVKLRNCLNLIR